jgi:four helix bundle protein
MFHGFRDLEVYQLAYQLAMEIFYLSKTLPCGETYSRTDQIRRSSRSVLSRFHDD